MTVFDDCTRLTPPNGTWETSGGTGCPEYPDNKCPGAILSIETLEGVSAIKVDCPPESYTAFNKKVSPRKTERWDWHLEPLLRFRIYVPSQINQDLKVTVGLITSEPDGGGFYSHSYGELDVTLDAWNVFDIDLRYDVNGNPVSEEALTYARQLNFNVKKKRNRAFVFYIGPIETLIGPPIDLGGLEFVVTDEAGNAIVEAEVTVGLKSELTDLYGKALFEAMLPGVYTAKITKKGYFQATLNVTVEPNVITTYIQTLPAYTPPPIIPATWLHKEGRFLKNQEGITVTPVGLSAH